MMNKINKEEKKKDNSLLYINSEDDVIIKFEIILTKKNIQKAINMKIVLKNILKILH